MLIKGAWSLCDDGMVRPVIRGEVQGADGSWVQVPFLLDTGADRTVLSADTLPSLRLQPIPGTERLAGVGGMTRSIIIETRIQFTREDGSQVGFRGQYAAMTVLEGLDMSVLGRDVTNLFAVIVDRPQDVICLLGQRHYYTIDYHGA